LGNGNGSEDDLVLAIVDLRTDGDPFADERFADFPGSAAEVDARIALHDAHGVAVVILQWGQPFGEGTDTRSIAAGGDIKAQSFVRPLVVVNVSPGIEAILARGDVGEVLALDHLDG